MRDMKAIDEAAHGDATDFRALAVRVEHFSRVDALHHRAEEIGMFAEIERKRPGATAMLVADHHDDEPLVDEIAALCRTASTASGDERWETVAWLRRRTSAARELLRRHIHKEEDIIVPVAEALFSIEEQGAQVGTMLAQFPPEEMQTIIPWMIALIGPNDRVEYVRLMKTGMPPDQFSTVAASIRDRIGAEDWAAIEAGL